MERNAGRLAPHLYAALRIIAGLMFATHGCAKIFGFPGGAPHVPFASLIGVAGFIELIGGSLIALGLLADYAAFLASGMMAVAYFMVHAPHGLLPLVNKGELAVLYCFLFLYIALNGSGCWSLDSLLRRSGTVEKETLPEAPKP